MRRLLLLVYLACNPAAPVPSTPPGRPVPTETDPALAARVDKVIDGALAEHKLVGVMVLIARDGKLVYSRAAGFADREAKKPVREDTVFRLASMTKPVVSVAALALVDRGKLSLEDPVTKWLPEFRPKLADGREPVITLRHLLTHTSGLGYTFTEPAGGPYHVAKVSSGLAEPGLSAAENLRRLASVPLHFEPGTSYKYGLSTDVLGEVVGRAGGSALPQVVKELLLYPLEMTDTSFVVDDRARLAWPYATGTPPARMTELYDMKRGDLVVQFAPARIHDSSSFPSAGAGLAGTARDYLKFAEAMRTGAILKPETLKLARENQIGDLADKQFGGGWGFTLGFGVVLDSATAKTSQRVGSHGWGGIYGTEFWIDLEAKLSVVILTNVAGAPLTELFEKAIYDPPAS